MGNSSEGAQSAVTVNHSGDCKSAIALLSKKLDEFMVRQEARETRITELSTKLTEVIRRMDEKDDKILKLEEENNSIKKHCTELEDRLESVEVFNRRGNVILSGNITEGCTGEDTAQVAVEILAL